MLPISIKMQILLNNQPDFGYECFNLEIASG